MKKSGWLALMCAGAAAVCVNAAMEAGAEPKEWPANPKRHTISVTRQAADAAGNRMIAAAENVKPASGQWWVVKNGEPVLTLGLKTPHAITKGAIDYYTAKIKEYQASQSSYSQFRRPDFRAKDIPGFAGWLEKRMAASLTDKEKKTIVQTKLKQLSTINYLGCLNCFRNVKPVAI